METRDQSASGTQDNPLLKQDNPYQSYIDKANEALQSKAAKEGLEIQRLAHSIFTVNPDGIELLRLLENRFMMNTLYSPITDNAGNIALYWEGYRDCLRSFKSMGLMHEQMSNGGIL